MCGISAVLALNGTSLDDDSRDTSAQLNESLDRIAHRGPDSRGIWVSDDNSVGTYTVRVRNPARRIIGWQHWDIVV